MAGIPARTQGLIASGLMAILVLSVFARSTYTGPESTLYQLHNGVLTRDTEAVKDALLQGSETGPARELLVRMERLLAVTTDYQVQAVDRQGRNAVVTVAYSSPRFGVVGVQYFLHKARSRWQVDADQTLGAMAVGARI